MSSLLAMLLGTMGASSVPTEVQRTCAKEVGAVATAYRLSELPEEIRADLVSRKAFFGDIGDSDGPLLETDAPSAAERNYPSVRFAQAMLVQNEWFVQVDVSMTVGVTTFSYPRQSDGRFSFLPIHYFRGPACASIKAALAGVTNPGGL